MCRDVTHVHHWYTWCVRFFREIPVEQRVPRHQRRTGDRSAFIDLVVDIVDRGGLYFAVFDFIVFLVASVQTGYCGVDVKPKRAIGIMAVPQ